MKVIIIILAIIFLPITITVLSGLIPLMLIVSLLLALLFFFIQIKFDDELNLKINKGLVLKEEYKKAISEDYYVNFRKCTLIIIDLYRNLDIIKDKDLQEFTALKIKIQNEKSHSFTEKDLTGKLCVMSIHFSSYCRNSYGESKGELKANVQKFLECYK